MTRIFLSTPLRNELKNLNQLVGAVSAQTYPITCWVIVENGSTDGSKDYLTTLSGIPMVEELVVVNVDTESPDYQLGSKYARLVNRGFIELQSRYEFGHDDLIGILDADSFPEPTYYEKLCKSFGENPRLGITSGLSYDVETMKLSGHSRDWVRGSCRLWRGACFLESGYIIGPSADTLSAARAEIDGWLVKVTKNASFCAREVGKRSNQKYYGASAYFRGNTVLYALLRAVKFVFRGKIFDAFNYLYGYSACIVKREKRIEDNEIRHYFRLHNRRLISRFSRIFGLTKG